MFGRCFGSGFGFDQVLGSGSGFKEAYLVPKRKKKKRRNFMFEELCGKL
jgi:hypothetical protein